MKAILGWEWQKLFIPPAIAKKRNTVVRIFEVSLADPEKFPDLDKLRRHDTVFITGDGHCLAEDVAEFNSWNIPHDIYAVNRSLIFHESQVQHWAAVDVEEACWFTEYVNSKVESEHLIIRHSIGGETLFGKPVTGLYDCYWNMEYEWENDYQRRVFVGNTGYFAVLTALKMGYKKIIIGGMPLDIKPHFYETEDEPGPLWTGLTYMQWMDFKLIRPAQSELVRSMSGYSAFILGTATREWARNAANLKSIPGNADDVKSESV